MGTMFEQMARGAVWDDLARVHGRTVTHNPKGGTPVDITAIWHPNQIIPGVYDDGTQTVEMGVLVVNPASTPGIEDTFMIDGETWAMKSLGRLTPFIELQLERREQERLGGEGARIQR